MPEGLADGDVIVTLASLAPPSFTFPNRRIFLSNQKRAVSIGRASKRSSTLEPRVYNAWIDAPVMSRNHAELKLDSQSQTVFIRDVGSLHGTYHNDTRLREGQSQALADGDVLKFGISIERARESFPQCAMRVNLKFGQPGDDVIVDSTETRPAVFQVPDESDCDDETSNAGFSSIDGDDDDDLEEQAIQASVAALQENGLELEFHGFDTSDPIDLTSEPDLVSEDIPSSSPVSHESDLPVHSGDYTVGTVDLDDTMVPASEAFAPATQYTQYTECASLGATQDLLPASDVSGPEVSLVTMNSLDGAKALGDLSGKLDYFMAREHNKLLAQQEIQASDESDEAEFALTAEPTPTQEDENSTNENEVAHKTEATPDNHVDGSSQEVTPVDPQAGDSSKKRKADQISEGEAISQPQQGTEEAPMRTASLSAPTSDNRNLVFKRIRTAAEFFGFAAVGGAAVVTALIATAPNF